MPKFLIIGAGPTGLGAAGRLQELGERDWLLLERGPEAGGLASSVIDEKGFTWDLGGHVQFSHYEYFDKLMDDLLGPDGWVHHEREAWVWMRDRFIPYPFQNNIRRLPREEMIECVLGLVRALKVAATHPPKPKHFEEQFVQAMGEGIARVFLRPYNFKVWAYPPDELNTEWLGERVAIPDVERVLRNIFEDKDDVSWGPNNTFRFPKHGGTGAIWREAARRLPQENLRFNAQVEFVDTKKKTVRLAGSGEEIPYEHLISSAALDDFLRHSDLANEFAAEADALVYSNTNIVGIGLHGQAPKHLETKCWMYFPEDDCPFYRVTVFSNYSKNNVPDPAKYWSLMAEVSESPKKPVDQETLVEETIRGALNTKLIEDRDQIASTFRIRLPHGYPTPFIGRDAILHRVLPALEARDVYSRGRFGAWKYEVSNQDHSLMMGVEAVDHILADARELTLWNPGVVNGPKPWKRRA